MNIPDRIKRLIETFDYNIEAYKKGSYNETQVRLEFINPFFEEMGWDITNKQGYAAIKNHLVRFTERLMPRPKDWKGEKWRGGKPGSYQWYEIQDNENFNQTNRTFNRKKKN